jgi:hypothetical protein
MHRPVFFDLGRITAIFFMSIIFAVIFLKMLFDRHWLIDNVALVALALAVSILLSFALPRLFKDSQTAKGFKEGAKRFTGALSNAITAMGLMLVYCTAVLFVFAVSRVSGKRFLELKQKKGLWHWHKKAEGNEQWKEMF